ncbi:MAG: serpin family protein [Clostridiaceae bacterium]|nr:serpin family protein [Clostridiaceae bacterium]
MIKPWKAQGIKGILAYFICFMLAAAILAGCGAVASYDLDKVESSIIEGNEQFAINIFKKLNIEDGDSNIFISPLSISTALTMTYNGAGSTTREAMAEALNYKDIELETINTGYKNLLIYLKNADSKVLLNISNSIWFREGEAIKQDFLARNKENFDARVSEIDFQDPKAADTINGWISESTKGKIDKMLDSPISPDVVMYLINAIYFKGQWTRQFDKKLTFDGTFITADGKHKEVKMMSRQGDVEYGEAGNAKIVKLPYGKEKISMYCILPEESVNINDYINQFDIGEWNELKDSLSKTRDVILQIPRFMIEYGIKDLNDSLTALGMGEAFGPSADFTGIREGIFISAVLHKAVIEVNEEGSEAAAATVVEKKETAMLEPTRFIADRPFIFIIADEETGTILFMGKLTDV